VEAMKKLLPSRIVEATATLAPDAMTAVPVGQNTQLVNAKMGNPFSCRICGRTRSDHKTGWGTDTDEADEDLELVLDLGSPPLANRLLTAAELQLPEPRYPLQVVFCNRCSLLQITETVPPEILFREYLYFSSFSETMLRHAQESAEELIEERQLGPMS